ncbi:regulator of Vps4 activity in the MVB pathway-domain-containing protein [Irpex rosettiformis]|uniref:Regulator of Vps4 activity in the MVB pathway-domain-containing protein n=1 Tax=Irpex rosettiformis TaxID=378272 RepID=A0ACB8UJH8_9APHY|nr:regulator of Vps4 activity in the MVB pathway-domain-containing protein [Irpex rosettiformis]
MAPWNSAKAKVQLRLGVQRLRTLQEKKAAQAKAARRDIALLLEKGKVETARIKVENIINEDIHVELLELLELYCELLLARFGLLELGTREPDPGINEGVCSIIYAAPRTELKELHVLRDILMHKYGREFSVAVMDNKDSCVSERITKKLTTLTPSSQLVDAYLSEIAKGYGIAWSPPGAETDHAGDDAGDGGVKEIEKSAVLEAPIPDASVISAEARKAGARTPKLPEIPPTVDAKESAPKVAPQPPPEDDFDALAKRFAALKKR